MIRFFKDSIETSKGHETNLKVSLNILLTKYKIEHIKQHATSVGNWMGNNNRLIIIMGLFLPRGLTPYIKLYGDVPKFWVYFLGKII